MVLSKLQAKARRIYNQAFHNMDMEACPLCGRKHAFNEFIPEFYKFLKELGLDANKFVKEF